MTITAGGICVTGRQQDPRVGGLRHRRRSDARVFKRAGLQQLTLRIEFIYKTIFSIRRLARKGLIFSFLGARNPLRINPSSVSSLSNGLSEDLFEDGLRKRKYIGKYNIGCLAAYPYIRSCVDRAHQTE